MKAGRHILPLTVLAVVIGGLTVAQAFLFEWFPDQGSAQADRTDTLMWFVFWASAAIFTLVAVVVVYCAWRFRAAPGDETDGPPTHGNTKLEVVWTIAPALLLAVIGVWAYLVLADNEALAGDRTEVDVTALQFAWEFTYPQAGITTGDLRLPAGRQVVLKMRAEDVIHNLWVPEWRVKQDIVPGITTRLIVTPDKVGTFPIICQELCGLGHNTMRAQAIVMEPAAYERWLADAQAQVAEEGAPADREGPSRREGTGAGSTDQNEGSGSGSGSQSGGTTATTTTP